MLVYSARPDTQKVTRYYIENGILKSKVYYRRIK